MKKCGQLLIGIVKKVVKEALKKDAHQTTCTIFYQPRVPAGLKQFRRNKE